MFIPVTTGANPGATVLHWGSTGLTPEHTRRPHRAWWNHRDCRRQPGLSRYLTALPVTSGCFIHFKTTMDMSRFNSVATIVTQPKPDELVP